MTLLRVSTLTTLLLALAPVRGAAVCVLPLPPPCQSLASHAVVLVADVLEVSDTSGLESHSGAQVVKMRIAERFKGVPGTNNVMTASIANEHEAVFLTAGKRYVIYANLHSNGFWDTRCSRTRPVDEATEELTQLRQCGKR
jgi:hypothetical protein